MFSRQADCWAHALYVCICMYYMHMLMYFYECLSQYTGTETKREGETSAETYCTRRVQYGRRSTTHGHYTLMVPVLASEPCTPPRAPSTPKRQLPPALWFPLADSGGGAHCGRSHRLHGTAVVGRQGQYQPGSTARSRAACGAAAPSPVPFGGSRAAAAHDPCPLFVLGGIRYWP